MKNLKSPFVKSNWGSTRQTKRMKEAVYRNMDRFPEDFVFELPLMRHPRNTKPGRKSVTSRGYTILPVPFVAG